MAYVEPCCCETQLPKLLRENNIFFHTSGDVTIHHFMKSIGCMAGNGSAMWLVAPDVDVKLLRKIRHWFARGWIVGLHLITNLPQYILVEEELKGCPNVEYVSDSMIVDGFLSFVGEQDAVAVQGAMLLEKAFATRIYAGWYGRRDSEKIKGLMQPFMSKMNIKRKIKRD